MAQKIGTDAKAAFGAAVGLILLGVLIGDGGAALVLAPLVFVLIVYVMARVPLRTSMLGLMTCVFTFENPAEGFGSGVWKSPFQPVGAMLLNHLNTVNRELTFTSWMSFSGMDLFLVSLLIISWVRKNTRSKIDSGGRIPTPQPLLRFALVSAAGTLFVLLNGFLHGGNFSKMLWQIDRVMYLPLLFFLFQLGIRGPQDHKTIAKVVLYCGAYKAVLATYIMRTTLLPKDPWGYAAPIPCATTHHDSMLFAACFVILITLVIERVPKARIYAACLVPVIAMGMIHNNRRLAWVQVALVFLTIYIFSADNPIKKKIRRILTFSTPAIIGYIMIGWNAGSRIFKPVQMMKSVVDAKSDGSSFWRELENFNLINTLRANPILGSGYGIGYTQYVAMPAVDYDLEYFLPHNSILGLWCFGGIIGYTCMTLLWGAGVYFSMRAYHAATDRTHRAAAQVCFGVVLIYMIQCWGDLGLGTWVGVFLMGASLAVGGKLAVVTGQWGGTKAPRPAQPVPGAAPRSRAEQAA